MHFSVPALGNPDSWERPQEPQNNFAGFWPNIVGDGNLVGLSRGLVRGVYIQNAVGVDVEGHLDLGHTARGWRDAIEVELTQQVVVFGHGALALEDLDQHTRLVVSVGGEGLALVAFSSGASHVL